MCRLAPKTVKHQWLIWLLGISIIGHYILEISYYKPLWMLEYLLSITLNAIFSLYKRMWLIEKSSDSKRIEMKQRPINISGHAATTLGKG